MLAGALGSRLVTKAMIVCAALGLTFAWRLDRAVGTAYELEWVADGDGLRLPTQFWVVAHAGVGLVSVGLLVGAALLWRRRAFGTFFDGVLGMTSLIAATVAVVLAAGAAVARAGAAEGVGKGSLSAVVALDLLALATVGSLALATGNLVYGGDGGLTGVFRRVFQRQRMNVVVVLALTAALAFVGDTSGQAIDSMRSWSPLVFDAEGAVWSSVGAARLTLGLSAALLLSLVVYESGIRLTQVTAALEEQNFNRLLGISLVPIVCGALLWKLLPFGPGIFLAGVVLLVVASLDRPVLSGKNVPLVASGAAEQNAPEWLAMMPLLALGATSVTATVEAALSGGVNENTMMSAVPAIALGLLAVLLTRLQPVRTMKEVPRSGFFAAIAVICSASLGLLLVGETWLAALFGLFWLVVFAVYAALLFHRPPTEATEQWRALSFPIAVGGGTAALVGINSDPLDSGRLLGVFTLVLLALAFALYFLHLAVRMTLRRRPPRLLWWFGLSQLPVLTLALIWWIGVGVMQTHFGPKSLHDVRLVERAPVAVMSTEGTTPPLERAFDQWLLAQEDLERPAAEGPVPLMLIAAHGGGIRAAYWTAAALDCIVGVSAEEVDPATLVDESDAVRSAARSMACSSRRRDAEEQRAAAKRIFIASGVSGGAVGLYAYARQLLHNGQLGASSDWIDTRLDNDFAGPAIGWALFHDLPNRLLGIHPDPGAPCGWKVFAACLRQNRAAVLEQTFDEEWELPSTAALLRRSYDLRFSEEADVRENARLLPLVAMNATLTGGEARAVISPADLGSWPQADADDPERGRDRLPLAGTVEIRDALCETNDIRLSTAALLAARFPYVTPSGHIGDRCGYGGELRSRDEGARCAAKGTRCEGRYVDGGYADNSGLFTIVALWPTLRGLVVEYNTKARAGGRREIAPMIVELDNHYQASLSASVPFGGSASESIIPLETGFGSRRAIETYARAAAYRILPRLCTVTISPTLHPGLIAPLGWELSPAARADLRSGLTRPHPGDRAGTLSVRLLREVQSRIAAPSERKVVFDHANTLVDCLPKLPTD
jgi:hypothetical protein